MNEEHTLRAPPAPSPTDTIAGREGAWVVSSVDAGWVGRCIAPTEGSPVALGRSAESDIVFADQWMSRQHVRLHRDVGVKPGELWRVEVIGSGPVTLNGQPVGSGHCALGDVLRFGATLLVFGSGYVSRDSLGFAGWSLHAETVRRKITRCAAHTDPVHVSGPTGSGKEVVAAALHARSRRSGPLVSVNAACVPENLFESQYFGATRGAFSGADRETRGYFGEANGGTLFIDEIGETPPAQQAKLLRAVETRTIVRVGEAAARPVDVLLVTATLRNLSEMAREGEFREDLRARLVDEHIALLPLDASRRLDVLPIGDSFWRSLSGRGLQEELGQVGEQGYHLVDVLERVLLEPKPIGARSIRQWMRRMHRLEVDRLRRRMSPIPPASEVVTAQPAAVAVKAPPTATITAEWYAGVKKDVAKLHAAIIEIAEGSVTDFARRVGEATDRRADAVRRDVYRALGQEGLDRLRSRDASDPA